jgi:hypothetical protein
LKIERQRDCERGGADGKARRGRIFEGNLHRTTKLSGSVQNGAQSIQPDFPGPRVHARSVVASDRKDDTTFEGHPIPSPPLAKPSVASPR